MRDIREDLLERLSACDAEMAAAKTRYDAARRELDSDYAEYFSDINERQRAVSRLLDDETRRIGVSDGTKRRPPSPTPALKLPLIDYILHFVGKNEKSKDDIKDAVERAGYENAGRSVHTTLLNMVRAGRLVNQGDMYSTSVLGHLILPEDRFEGGSLTTEGHEPPF